MKAVILAFRLHAVCKTGLNIQKEWSVAVSQRTYNTMAFRKGNKITMIYNILHRKLNHGESGAEEG